MNGRLISQIHFVSSLCASGEMRDALSPMWVRGGGGLGLGLGLVSLARGGSLALAWCRSVGLGLVSLGRWGSVALR